MTLGVSKLTAITDNLTITDIIKPILTDNQHNQWLWLLNFFNRLIAYGYGYEGLVNRYNRTELVMLTFCNRFMFYINYIEVFTIIKVCY